MTDGCHGTGADPRTLTDGAPAGKRQTGLGGSVRLAALAFLLAGLAACGSTRGDPDPYVPRQRPVAEGPARLAAPSDPGWQEQPGFVRPRHMNGRTPIRVALLLPFGAEDPSVQRVAEALKNAAQLGLFEVQSEDLLLLPKDTKGTPSGALAAAEAAINDGAELILGPLFASSVSAIAGTAQRRSVPIVAFSSDRTVAGSGIHLLSFQVEEEIRRVVAFAATQSMTDFAALVPENAYGDRVAAAFRNDVSSINGTVRHLVSYQPSADDFRAPVRQLAEYTRRRAALEEQRQALASRQDAAARRALSRLKEAQTWGPVSFQAVLLPDGGATLRSLAPTLPYYDIDNRSVRFLGTGLWDDASLWKEQSLQGGWFAAPPPDARSGFTQRFQATYGYSPPRIASLGYDAVTLAAVLASGDPGERFTETRLTNRDGFIGIDGIFRFIPQGGTERGLAILEIRDGAVTVVGPAPRRFPADEFAAEDESLWRPGT
ncbi:MAG: penicillin-binding protein activator [Alphaproteobacteria bacterium]